MSNRTTPSPATQPAQAGKSSMTTSQGQGHSHQTAIPHDKIATRAYEKWCQRGCTDGTQHQDWLDAETELRAEMTGGKGSPPAVQSMQQPAPGRPVQATAMPQKPAQRR
jgi:Protein of unknown function (DUF2934)